MKFQFFILCSFLFLVNIQNVFAKNADTTHINQLLNYSKQLQRSNQDSSLYLAKAAYELADKINFKKGIATACIRIGSILFTNGKLDSAQYYLTDALDIRSALNDAKGQAGACIMLSYVFQHKGKQDSAYSYMYEALRLNQVANDSISMVQIYNNLGNLSTDFGDQVAAIDYFQKAENIAKDINYLDGIIFTYDGLGRMYLNTKDFKKALQYFMQIDNLSKNAKDDYSVAQNLTNIGLCYDNMNDMPTTKYYYQKALNYYLQLNTSDIALGYTNVASVFINMYQPDSALYLLNKALPLARQSNDLKTVAICYEALSKAYYQKKDFENAYLNNKHYTDLRDTMLNNEKVKQIAEMQAKYETIDKEKQIALLNTQNKAKNFQRNIFIGGTILFLLLASGILRNYIKASKERKKSEDLLLNILPVEVAQELKNKGSSEARDYESATVLFTDFKDFTKISEQLSPTELLKEINHCFSAFDIIIAKYGVEKIKTIGDAYMCAGGVPVKNRSHAFDVVKAGIEIRNFINSYNIEKVSQGGIPFEIRIGINTGPLVAGIVGVKKFAYDIWGDSVNTASRMESNGAVGKVNISGATFEIVKEKFICTYRGKIAAKNKGEVDMYFAENKI